MGEYFITFLTICQLLITLFHFEFFSPTHTCNHNRLGISKCPLTHFNRFRQTSQINSDGGILAENYGGSTSPSPLLCRIIVLLHCRPRQCDNTTDVHCRINLSHCRGRQYDNTINGHYRVVVLSHCRGRQCNNTIMR